MRSPGCNRDRRQGLIKEVTIEEVVTKSENYGELISKEERLDKKKIPKQSGEISRREFLKDAGLVVGGAAIGSTVLLAACGDGEVTTETVTETTTETATVTETETVTKFVCPFDGQEFDTLDALTAHVETAHPGEVEVITKFVCPYCSEELATLAALVAHVEAEHPAEVAPANVVKFTVNGWPYELQVEPEDTLHSVLRDKLGVTSPKDMCNGYGACGSCSVIMEGRPILSCMALAIECDGAIIETAEGLADANHPLIEAYIMNHCMQCGYCTPGFIVTAKALLDHNPNPTEEDVKDALGGNICRCGTYPMHIIAVQEAAGSL